MREGWGGRLMAALGGVLILLATFLAVRLAPSSSASTPVPAKLAAAEPRPLPHPTRPAFVVPEPRELEATRASRWATVIEAVPVRSAPDSSGSAIGSLMTRTPEGTSNVVLVVRAVEDEAGRLWVGVRIPALPKNVNGWVPRAALGAYTFVRTHLVVDLERLRATLLYDGRRIFEAGVGIGAPASPTPTGEFYVRSKIVSFRSPVYGPLAFGTSARSNLTDWPGGGFIGIHGTNRPELLPGRVSHGCIRMRNDDILELSTLMPVGTPLTIRT